MGLKTSNYKVEKYGLTLPEVYCYCENIHVDNGDNAYARFGIYQNREDALNTEINAFETYNIIFKVDKDMPLWVQAYRKAKSRNEKFYGWEDDVEEIHGDVITLTDALDALAELGVKEND